jgi:hypothetical protein
MSAATLPLKLQGAFDRLRNGGEARLANRGPTPVAAPPAAPLTRAEWFAKRDAARQAIAQAIPEYQKRQLALEAMRARHKADEAQQLEAVQVAHATLTAANYEQERALLFLARLPQPEVTAALAELDETMELLAKTPTNVATRQAWSRGRPVTLVGSNFNSIKVRMAALRDAHGQVAALRLEPLEGEPLAARIAAILERLPVIESPEPPRIPGEEE